MYLPRLADGGPPLLETPVAIILSLLAPLFLWISLEAGALDELAIPPKLTTVAPPPTRPFLRWGSYTTEREKKGTYVQTFSYRPPTDMRNIVGYDQLSAMGSEEDWGRLVHAIRGNGIQVLRRVSVDPVGRAIRLGWFLVTGHSGCGGDEKVRDGEPR